MEGAQKVHPDAWLDPENSKLEANRIQRAGNMGTTERKWHKRSFLSSPFVTGSIVFEVIKQHSFQLPAAFWITSSCSWTTQHPWLCADLPLQWHPTRHSCPSLLPAAFQPPAAAFSFLLLYMSFVISSEYCLHFVEGRWNWICFQARFSKEESSLWCPAIKNFFTSPSAISETGEVTWKSVSFYMVRHLILTLGR